MVGEKFISRKEFGQMTRVLLDDVEHCWAELHKAETKADQDFWKRAFTRSVFAEIEGFTEFFRAEALNVEFGKIGISISSGASVEFDPGLISVLGGDSFSVGEDGEIKIQKLKTPFLHNLLFCFKRFADAHNAKVQIQKGDHWRRIRSAVQVRDGLMHPKTLKCLEISEREIEDVAFTIRWFLGHLNSILKQNYPGEESFNELSSDFFKLKLKKL